MRSLNDYFTDMGSITIKTAAQASGAALIVDSGRIKEFIFNTTEEITGAAGSANIYVNETDSGVDVTFPVTAVNTGGTVQPDADLYVDEGDALYLDAVGESTLGIITVQMVIRR